MSKQSRRQRTPHPPEGKVRRRLAMESLEDRFLLSGGISEFAIPTANSAPVQITPGPDGALWFVENNTGTVGRVTTGGAVGEFPFPSASKPKFEGLTVGPDGALWFGEEGSKQLGRITTAGSLSEVSGGDTSDVERLVTGPDNNLWITDAGENQITQLTPSGTLTYFSVPTANSGVEGLTVGSDGALWFTELNANKIGRLTVGGTFTEYDVPTASAGLENITAGPDGALWFVEKNANKIGRLTTGGSFTEFNVPTPVSGPNDLVAGPDGAVWFTELNADKIGRITTSGSVTEYVVPTANSGPHEIAVGADGNIWFTENSANQVGRLLVDLQLTATGVAVTATEGQGFRGTVASFTDGDATATAADYTVTLDWGDGSTSGGLVVANGSGGFDVVGAHDYVEEGSRTVNVRIDDVLGASASAADTATVVDAPLTASGQAFTATEGQAFQGTVASFTDADAGESAGDYSAVITWGDGTTSAGTVTANGSGGFDVVGAHAYAEEGSVAVSVLVQDAGAAATVNTTSQVRDADPVVVGAASPLRATEGVSTGSIVLATFTDPDPGATTGDYSATIQWGDGSTSLGIVTANGGGFQVAGDHVYADEGAHLIAVDVVDSGGGAGSASVNVAVVDAPLSTRGTTLALSEGMAFRGVVASFSDGNAGAGVGDYTAVITWGDGTTSAGIVTPNGSGFDVNGSHLYAEEGNFAVSVRIVDVGGETASVTSTVAVADMPLTAVGSAINATEGSVYSGTVAQFTDTDPNGATGDYTAAIDWGDGTTSAGVVTANGLGGFTVTGSHAYAEEGTFAPQVTIADAGGAAAAATDTAAVVDAALTAAGRTIQATEGTVFQGTVASFTDADPGGVAGDYSATITWGDGSTSAGTVAANGSGGFDVVGTHTYTEEGPDTVAVSLRDAGGATSLANGNAAIADAPLTGVGQAIGITAGQTFRGRVATFTDADPNGTAGDYSALINWGDGTTSAGSIVANGSGGFDVVGAHVYAAESNYTFGVAIQDAGSSITVSGNATVNDAPLSAVGVAVAATEGGSFRGTVASFTDADPNGTVSDYSAVIRWGDGSTSAGAIVANGSGGFDIVGSHVYAEEGSNAVAVSIRDRGGATTTANTNATVADAALRAAGQAVRGTEGQAFQGTVASFTDADPAGAVGDYQAVIAWGDGSTSAGIVAANGAGGFDVVGAYAYTEEGAFTVAVSIQDAGGAAAVTAGSVQVVDAPLTAVGQNLAATEGQTFHGTVASFSDADAGGVVGDFAAVIAWGDGSTSLGSVVANGSGGFDIAGSHAYAEEGSFAVRVALQDAGGTSATTSRTAAVTDALLSAAGLALRATEGRSFQGTVASFADADPGAAAGDFAAVVAWGDGSTSAGTIAANGAGGFAVVGTHTYAEEGSFAVAVTVHDTGGAMAATGSRAAVADASLTASGQNIGATEGLNFQGTVASFRDADPGAEIGDFHVVVAWGDGTTSLGTVAVDGHGGFAILGAHTYAEEGQDTIRAVIQDMGGATVTAAGGQATVADATLTATGQTIDAVGGQAFQGTVALFTDANPGARPGDFSAVITWSDGATAVGTVVSDGHGGFDVLGTHTYADRGTYAAAVAIHDRGDAVDTTTNWVVVFDAPVTIAARKTPVAALAGTSTGTQQLATFTDANPTHTAASYTALIAWGDGTTSLGSITAESGGGFEVTGSHAYAAGGSFAAGVTLEETLGERFVATSTVQVAAPSLPVPPPAQPVSTGVSVFALPPQQETLQATGGPTAAPARPAVFLVSLAVGAAKPLDLTYGVGGSETPAAPPIFFALPPPPVSNDRHTPLTSFLGGSVPTVRPSLPALWPMLTDSHRVLSSGLLQNAENRGRVWLASTELLEGELARLGQDLDSDGWPRAMDATFVTGATLTAGYLMMNLRSWYFVAGGVLSAPAWRQLDPLAVLDVWDKDGKGGVPPGGDEDDEEEEELGPVFG